MDELQAWRSSNLGMKGYYYSSYNQATTAMADAPVTNNFLNPHFFPHILNGFPRALISFRHRTIYHSSSVARERDLCMRSRVRREFRSIGALGVTRLQTPPIYQPRNKRTSPRRNAVSIGFIESDVFSGGFQIPRS